MIKTLRITSILIAVSAIILGGFLVFRLTHGIRSDENIREFLNSPGVIEKFTAAEGQRAQAGNNQTSPLVQQARAFALYLNPPAPKVPRSSQGGRTTTNIGSQVNVTPKFPVIGITYYQKRPEMSMALIDEPGRGIHWVKQSMKVGHFVIEEVKDNVVIVKSGTQTFNLNIERDSSKSTGRSPSNVPKRPSGTANSRPRTPQPPSRTRTPVRRAPSRSPQPLKPSDDEKNEKLKELYSRLEKLQLSTDDADSGLSEEERAEQTSSLAQLISSFKASYVSPEEAKKLDELAEQLNDMEENEPNIIDFEENEPNIVDLEENEPNIVDLDNE